jgi:peptide/nickel transport system substrate-binding protein
MEEREALFTQALALALNDTGSGSVRVWLVDETSFTARRADTVISNDLVGGVSGSQMWPYVIRFENQEGGTVRIAQQALLVEPWNPVAGSSWTYDQMPIGATQDYGLLSDPVTGLAWSQRVERSEVVALAGLPVTRTLDWVDLHFAPTLDVPADAWVDWDAAAQRFITAGEKYPGGLTASVKSTVYYPTDLFTTVTWHDGSPLDLADFVMSMILQFDRGKPQSAIYDEYDGVYASLWSAFMNHFRGVRITSTDPLVIETYDSQFQLDAELNVNAWWPNLVFGPAAWHNLALGVRAEADGQLAFSADKASSLGVEWMNWVGGDSLDILAHHLDPSTAQSYIPYAPTLSLYVTPAEAAARWEKLQAWYAARGHFWLGTGPFYLESADPVAGTVVLQHYAAFPDLAGRWDRFAAPTPVVEINYASGAPGSLINVTGNGFPPSSTATVVVNGETLGQQPVSAGGTIGFTLDTAGAEEGVYHLAVQVNPVAGARFILDSAEPVRSQEGELPLVAVPPDLALHEVYLPLSLRADDLPVPILDNPGHTAKPITLFLAAAEKTYGG